jgi:hypothetical protein
MTKYKLTKVVKSELQKLNEQIDYKIVNGIPYKRDAERHKALLLRYYNLVREKESWLHRSLNFVSTFVL